jgi:hypothetical protein
MEPCAGDQAIAKIFKKARGVNRVYTNDINPVFFDTCDYGYDATLPILWQQSSDWVVSNPPYTQPTCQQIIENAWNSCNKGIAFLLRLSYLEPCKERVAFLQGNPLSHLIILNPRPRFRTDTKGTDNTTSAWFVWQKGWQDNTQIIYENNWKY